MSNPLSEVLGLTSILSILLARWRKPPTPQTSDFAIGDLVTDGVIIGTVVDRDERGVFIEPRRMVDNRYRPVTGEYDIELRHAKIQEAIGSCPHGYLSHTTCIDCTMATQLRELRDDIATLALNGCTVEMRNGRRTVVIESKLPAPTLNGYVHLGLCDETEYCTLYKNHTGSCADRCEDDIPY